ncbi:malonic semialdehyde reductase [Amphiplicatus metriothermophilus]|uniref:Putative NADH dehydrogenase/NAD(P)H nitroreductase SAMN06297382_0603 n=1 Tax=Amphiplicatus metriothermophilus TaxID=1519374 RepID=A0A239PKE4_9PROT|nr:malonic semialdehyde reductase [Amphiplicatus metriothermophilus]MBB5517558.1 3-hydroxypropanoate dehydrogenase [Amphiplicatus metriothermophilus]SNT68107.1 3-hydroxypropanoate dehydrogenase [Amphiplicatus metriothermophilus]
MSDKMINDEALDIIFREARTRNGWEDRPVTETLMQAVYDLMKWGPTSANCCPARFVFVTTPEGKKRLEPHLSEGNRAKTMAAPCCVIIGYDLEFHEYLPKLFPHTDAKSWFEGKQELIRATAFRNGTLQGAYFIIAARALGLDCGPMSGFDNEGVDREFFAGTKIKSNFLCNIGYGTEENLFPRSPRFAFDEVCKIV